MLTDITNLKTWLDYRRKRCWVLALVLVYTLTGFVIAPWALGRLAPDLALEFTQREISAGEISFNPFTLRLEITDLRLLDDAPVNPAQPNLLALDSVVINVAFTQLLQLTLGFDEISLNRPQIFLARYAFADTNWGRMLNDIEAAEPPVPEPEDPAASEAELRLFIEQLAINEGALTLEDELTEDTFNTRIEPINITVNNLSTLADVSGQQSIKLVTENGVDVTWEGSLELNPLVSSGSLSLRGSPFPTIYRYFEKQLGFTLDNCCLEIDLNYALESRPDGEVDVQVADASLVLSNFNLSMKAGDEPVLLLPALRIEGGELAWPQQIARVGLISFDNPEVFVWLNKDGSTNLDELLAADAGANAGPDTAMSDNATRTEKPTATDNEAANPTEGSNGNPTGDSIDSSNDSSGTPAAAEAEAPWDVEIDELRIAGMQFAVTDRSLPTEATVQLNPLNLSVRDISSAPNSSWLVEFATSLSSGGNVGFDGALIAQPEVVAEGELTVADLQLAALQPWVATAAQVAVQGGAVNLNLNIKSAPAETLRAAGDVSIAGLDISDTIKNESLLGWQSLQLQSIDFLLAANTLTINRVALDRPFARLIIAPDGTTNFDSLAAEPAAGETAAMETEAASDAAPEGPPLAVKVASTAVDNGAVDFADQSLPLPFRVMIEEFSGTMSAIDSTSQQPSKLDFKGRVGEFGQTRLKGDVAVMAPDTNTNVQLDFSNLSMPTLSPYTAEFAGRAIESGKLDLALDYRLDNRKIDGANNMVIKDFSLGEKVPSDDAMSLPLDLAIALLTDANGVIDIDLQVQGDMDDPGFSASGIVLKAFANLITKAAAAPFKLLGNLIPGGSDLDLEAIEFEPGLTELSPPEQEKLLTVAAALRERPALQLQLNGGYAPAADRAALQASNLNNQLGTLLGRPDPSTEQTRKGLEKLAKQQLPEVSLSALRSEFDLPDPNTGKQRFDELAYSAELRARLEANQPVDDEYLLTLGRQRRDMMVAFLNSQTTGGMTTDEVITGDIAEASLDDRGLVRVPLAVVPVAGE